MEQPVLLFSASGPEHVFTAEDVEGLLSRSESVEVKIALPTLGSTNDYLDIAEDFVYASFVLENLAISSRITGLRMEYEDRHAYVVVDASYSDRVSLAKIAERVQWAVNYNDDDSDEIRKSVSEEVSNYIDSIDSTSFAVPEIVDKYYANLVNGAYWTYKESYVDCLSAFPERAFGFWRSCCFDRSMNPVLVSCESWLVPKTHDLFEVFRKFDYDEISLLPASLLVIDGEARVVSGSESWKFRASALSEGPALMLLTSDEVLERSANHYISAKVSEFGDFLILESPDHYQIIREGMTCASPERMISSLRALESMVIDDIEPSTHETIDWDTVDDEKFEKICYEVIYHNSKFDRSTIRKMGRSRSRDGGRDIVVNTRVQFGEPAKLFIFQCKALAPDRSLSTGNIGSVSDVIDQYGAQGYGVLTTGLIDATLYDRLDGIARNRGIELMTWSLMEIEQFLLRRPHLLAKYDLSSRPSPLS